MGEEDATHWNICAVCWRNSLVCVHVLVNLLRAIRVIDWIDTNTPYRATHTNASRFTHTHTHTQQCRRSVKVASRGTHTLLHYVCVCCVRTMKCQATALDAKRWKYGRKKGETETWRHTITCLSNFGMWFASLLAQTHSHTVKRVRVSNRPCLHTKWVPLRAYAKLLFSQWAPGWGNLFRLLFR